MTSILEKITRLDAVIADCCTMIEYYNHKIKVHQERKRFAELTREEYCLTLERERLEKLDSEAVGELAAQNLDGNLPL